MRLTAMNFYGYMTDLGRQHWHIAEDTSNDSSSVKTRMIDWFQNKSALERACPLNVFEVAREELDVNQEDDIFRNATDQSWSMVCPMANRVRSATNSDTTNLE